MIKIPLQTRNRKKLLQPKQVPLNPIGNILTAERLEGVTLETGRDFHSHHVNNTDSSPSPV